MATHPSPFNRQRQPTKALDPTGQTAKFLYAILKQLDLKNIDWNEVASGLDITNGHAARMRWSRFRAQIEGSDNSYSRKSNKKKDIEKKRKKDLDEDDQPQDKLSDYGSKKFKTEGVFGGELNAQYDEFQDGFGPNTSTINGLNVHHAKLTEIPLHQDYSSLPYPSKVEREDYTSANTNARSKNPTFDAQKTVYKPTATPIPSQRPQQYFSSYNQYLQPQPPQQAPMPYNSLYSYTNQYQNYSMYPNQYQQRHRYGQQTGYPMQMQQPQMYNVDSMNRSTANMHLTNPSANTAQKTISMNMQPPQTSMSGQRYTPSAQSTNQSSSIHAPPISAQAQLCEMASDEPYPWPHSEHAIPDYLIDPALTALTNSSHLRLTGEVNNAPSYATIPIADLSLFKPSPSVIKDEATMKQNTAEGHAKVRDTITVNQSLQDLPERDIMSEVKNSDGGTGIVKTEPGLQ